MTKNRFKETFQSGDISVEDPLVIGRVPNQCSERLLGPNKCLECLGEEGHLEPFFGEPDGNV